MFAVRAWAFSVVSASALVGAAAALTLAAPPSDPDRAAAACFSLVTLPWGRQLAVSCDAFTFLRGAVNPALLLEPTFAPPSDFTYQSRPLHIGLAAGLGRVIQPLVATLVPAEALFQGRTPIRRYAGAYTAYVLINAAILVAAGLALHDVLVGLSRTPTPGERMALLAGFALLILGVSVRRWLLTPHTVLWGLLIPLWALAVGRRASLPAVRPPTPLLLRASAAAGLAALAYGYALLVPATAATALGLRLIREEGSRRGLARWARAAAPALGLFLLPPLTWLGISYAVSGGFYHHEAEAYRQFRWLPDAVAAGGPAHALTVAGEAAWRWTTIAARELGLPAVGLAALLAVAARSGETGEIARRLAPTLKAAGTVVLLGIGFWYLNGDTQAGRIATLGPVVETAVVTVALELDRRAGRVVWTSLLAATAVGGSVWALGTRPIF
jgi:hypothetical protein